MKIDRLSFEKDYDGSLSARIDWVAGGHFDGYMYRLKLRFRKEGCKVIRTKLIVDKSSYDGEINSSEMIGTFSDTDKATLTCVFEDFEMRGKILGDKNQFIAFDVWPKNRDFDNWSECYELK